MKIVRYGAMLLLSLCMLCSVAAAETDVVLTFAGDCTLGGEDKLIQKETSFATYAQREGYAYFLEQVKDLFATDDLTVVNLEGVLKSDFYGKIEKKFICFRGLPEYATILPLGSVEAVNLSNNHVGDYSAAGRDSTVKALLAAGVHSFDATRAYIFEKDGVRIAFCGFWCTGYHRHGDEYRAMVRELKQQGADAVVVSLHFGQEYHAAHNKAQTAIAHAMIDAGADLVIGHHPHVLQGTEVYHGRTILYSLGNFVFGGNAEVRAQACLIGRVTLTFGDDGAYQAQQLRLYAAHISGSDEHNDYQPRLVQGDVADQVFTLVNADSRNMPAPILEGNGWRDYPMQSAEQK